MILPRFNLDMHRSLLRSYIGNLTTEEARAFLIHMLSGYSNLFGDDTLSDDEKQYQSYIFGYYEYSLVALPTQPLHGEFQQAL